MIYPSFKWASLPCCTVYTSSLSLRNQRGFSFLELLISLLIFSIGFLGLAALQNVSLKMTHDSILQASAVSLSSELVDQLRVKREHFDLSPWVTRVKDELPEGDVVLTQQGEVYQLEISWQESQYSDDSQSIQHYPLTFRLHEPR